MDMITMWMQSSANIYPTLRHSYLARYKRQIQTASSLIMGQFIFMSKLPYMDFMIMLVSSAGAGGIGRPAPSLHRGRILGADITEPPVFSKSRFLRLRGIHQLHAI